MCSGMAKQHLSHLHHFARLPRRSIQWPQYVALVLEEMVRMELAQEKMIRIIRI